MLFKIQYVIVTVWSGLVNVVKLIYKAVEVGTPALLLEQSGKRAKEVPPIHSTLRNSPVFMSPLDIPGY